METVNNIPNAIITEVEVLSTLSTTISIPEEMMVNRD